MSVIIKGVDMPENCKKCDLRYGLTCVPRHRSLDGYVNEKKNQKPGWCPITPDFILHQIEKIGLPARVIKAETATKAGEE